MPSPSTNVRAPSSPAVANSPQWMSAADAAALLGVPLLTLRRSFDRHARKGKDGAVEARVDGITARKLGRLWRVALDPAWTAPKLVG